MRTWLTASDIAALGLPGFPRTKRGVLDLATREGWYGRTEMVRQGEGRGGQAAQFHVDLLPVAAKAALSAALIGRVAGSEALLARAVREPGADDLTPPAKENRDARLAVLDHIDRFRAANGLAATTADGVFVGRYNLGRVEVDGWIKEALPELSTRTVSRWRAMVRAGTLTRLAVDHGAKRRGKGKLADPAVAEFILGLIARQPHLSADHVRTIVADRFPKAELPQVRTFRTAITELKAKHKVALAKVTDPDRFNSAYRVSGTNSHAVSRLNELVMIDASPVDVLTLDGRHSVYLAIDIYSRRLRLFISRTPRAAAVAELLRSTTLSWGCPERIKTDNGSDFTAKATVRLLAFLNIDTETSTPFSPWEKGHVESAIKTFQHDFGPLMPGFVGHSVKDRKVIEARRAFAQRIGDTEENAFSVELTARELQDYADRWANERYAHREHSGLHGATPFNAAAGYVGRIKTVDPRALDVLLQPVAGQNGIRKVQKTGIRIDGSHYLAPPSLIGTDVLVRMDTADMGRVLLFSPDGETWLGEAVCPALAGVDPAEAVAQARAAQQAILKEGTAEIRKAMKAIKPRDMIDAVLREAERQNANVVAFPRASEAHTTPALDAALAAASAQDGIGVGERLWPEAVEAPVAGVIGALPGVHQLHETPAMRFRRARRLEADMAEGRGLSPADGLWLTGYRQDDEYQSFAEMYAEFGEEAL